MSRPSPRKVASLSVGRWEWERLLYAGKVGTGYPEWSLVTFASGWTPTSGRRLPSPVPVVKPKATWVEPVFEAEVDFTATTGDGLLREAVFKGLRERV